MLNKKNALLILICVAVVAACVLGAQGQTTTNEMQFSSVPITNDCNGETILMTGTTHTVSSFTTNPNGSTHFKFDFTTHATGVGQTTGWNYVINDSSHQEVNTKGIAQEQSFGTKMKLISQGPAPNLNERTTLHVVIDKDNNIKVDRSTDTISCK